MRIFDNFKEAVITQSLPGHYKQPLSIYTCIFLILLGIINITLGVITLNIYSNLTYFEFPYELGSNDLKFTVNDIDEPVNIYIQSKNFYASHFLFARSYSKDQLEGKATESLDSCKPLRTSGDKIIYPCGLLANSYNQDSVRIFDDEGSEIEISINNIAWTSSIDRIKNTTYKLEQISAPPLWNEYEEVPMLAGDERFANWISQSSYPTFRKLIGRLTDGLKAGEYDININATSPFGINSLILTTSSWAGNKNTFLSVFMIVVGCILISIGTIFWIKKSALRRY